MKAKVTALFSGSWPDGALLSPIPGQVVEVPDSDTDRVAYLRRLADEGQAEILEDVAADAAAGPAADAATKSPRRGRPPLPRDDEGNVIRT